MDGIFHSGGGFGEPVNLTSLLNAVNATWVAPVDGIMSNYIRVSTGTGISGYWYLQDTTLHTYACMLNGDSGKYIMNASPVVKGHTYTVTDYSNTQERRFTFYPFK